MRLLLGLSLISVPFLIMFAYAVWKVGLLAALVVHGVIYGAALLLLVGLSLVLD